MVYDLDADEEAEDLYLSVLFPATRSFEGRRFRSVSYSECGDEMRPIAKSEPVFIFRRAPPNNGVESGSRSPPRRSRGVLRRS
jgi:hypothetical protein